MTKSGKPHVGRPLLGPAIIRQSGAALWIMQETKCSETNLFKMNNFIIYEKVREAKEGGGISIGTKKSRIWETPTLSTDADSRSDTNFERFARFIF